MLERHDTGGDTYGIEGALREQHLPAEGTAIEAVAGQQDCIATGQPKPSRRVALLLPRKLRTSRSMPREGLKPGPRPRKGKKRARAKGSVPLVYEGKGRTTRMFRDRCEGGH